MNRGVEERFFAKVQGGDYATCWEWTACLVGGYGQFWDGTRDVYAHRWAYEFMIGEIPGGLTLDHLCRNRACVNPYHLEPVTNRENVRRGDLFKVNGAKTHCPAGHPHADATRYGPDGRWRRCRPCGAATARRYRARKHAA